MTEQRIPKMYEATVRSQCEKIFKQLDPSNTNDRQIVQEALQRFRRHSFSILFINEQTGSIVIQDDESALKLSLIDDLPFTPIDDAKAFGFFLFVYAQFDSVQEKIREWKETGDPFSLSLEQRTPDHWIQVLRHVTEPLRTFSIDDAPHLFLHEAEQIRKRCIPLMPYEWEWQPIFTLYFSLIRLDASVQYIDEQLATLTEDESYDYWQLSNWLEREQAMIERAVEMLNKQPRLFETDPFFDAFIPLLHTFAIEQTPLFSVRFQTYEYVWTHLFTQPERRLAEYEKLQQSDAIDAPFFLLFFTQFFDTTTSTHENDWIERLSFDAFERVLTFAKYAESEGVDEWVKACATFIERHYETFIRESDLPHHQIIALIETIDNLFDSAGVPTETRERLFQQFQPYSFSIYARFLMSHHRWSDWVALMHAAELSYVEINKRELQTVEKHAPRVLLPLFHRFVEEEMKERTRPHYQQAVRFLEKMRELAEASALHDWWNRYMDTLKNRHARLRAFQEELKKGQVYTS